MRSIFLIVFVALLTNINAQINPQWTQIFNGSFNGNDIPRAMTIDKDGNVIVTGQTQVGAASQDYDCITIKYNSSGSLIWSKTFNGAANGPDAAYSVSTDNLGNIYIAGSTLGNGTDYDFLTIKYDANGNEQWIKTYNYASNLSDIARFVLVNSSGEIIVSGDSYSAQTGTDFTLIKYDTNGNEIWIQRFTGSGVVNDYVKGMVLDDLDNIYLTGNSGNTQVDFLTVKYSSDGSYQWDRKYNGIANLSDAPYSIAVDKSRNIYVTGSVGISATNLNYLTIKYDTDGNSIWLKTYDGPAGGIDIAQSVTVDNFKNVYVTGYSAGSGSAYDYATIKYDSLGKQQWVSRYNGTGNSHDQAYKIVVNTFGDIYVTGESNGTGSQSDFLTVKYDNQGTELWTSRYNGVGNSYDAANSLVLDATGNAYVSGYITGTGYDFATLKYSEENLLRITRPLFNNKFIAGTVDTIKWIGGSTGKEYVIEYSTDNGANWFLVGYSPAENGHYDWEVPIELLTTKAKIKISDVNNTSDLALSYTFKIKPYILTRIDENGDYYKFKKDRDQWGFGNDTINMWPKTWYQQFKYRGIDPFTGKQYSQTQGNRIFAKAQDFYFPDWVSWVRTFGVNQCYHSTSQGIYNTNAMLKWWSLPIEKGWDGSCFGIAGTNALAFRYKDLFLNRFPSFPSFTDPITVDSSGNVRRVVNEIFTHQFGLFSMINDTVSSNKTPVQTLNELKELLLEDNATIRTISIINQNPTQQNPAGGHTILAYSLEQDTLQGNLFYVKIYDNSKPLSTTPITIDIFANGGNGSWSTPDWPNWGGSKGFYLEIPSEYYLSNENLYKRSNTNSPFILAQTELEINDPSQSNIKIIDSQGNETSYENGAVINDIPGAKPQIIKNGSSMPPYGYMLKKDNYSVMLKDFVQDTVNTFFFTGNKSFMYERYGAYNEQTDNLYFDGGLAVINSDVDKKTISLLGIVDEYYFERLYSVNNIDMNQNDSIKIENFGNSNIKLTSFGSNKNYDIELNTVGGGLLVFKHNNIPLQGNTSHFIVPDWFSLSNKNLEILVDINNDGSIDDTISLANETTGIGDDQGLLFSPKEYYLAQNYPNPFNPSTTIQYSIPKSSNVEVKIYDVLGNEIATLVNEYKPAGSYEVNFDAKGLSSGIYFYKLQAGSFTQTRKMILMK